MKSLFLGCLLGAGLVAIRHADQLAFGPDVAVTGLGLFAIICTVVLGRDDKDDAA